MPPETVHAPEFSPSLAWLNTTRPLSLRELRGQLVILDFWTYCCINCMHVLPTLRLIEERHKNDPLVVIGVHSAKFDGEKDAARIDEAIRRYDIHHPVVVDRDMTTWSAFAIRSWPTLVVIRPDGTLAAVAPGEPDAEVLDRFITEELAIARKKGQLATSPFPVDAPPRAETGALAYPGKLALGPDGSIAVADSGHHRVLVLDREGSVRHCFDGFDDPQGLAWRGANELFVADARLHTVSRIDLAAKTTTIVAGTGELGEAPIKGTSPALTTALRSPWDLLLDGDALYVAVAGSHQIAKLDLRENKVSLVSGTGAESIVDGPFAEATFSQPSGLAKIGTKLYVADSETSAVRELDLTTKQVRTVVGRGLFDFGDVDGPRDVALLQHCIGLTATNAGDLIVADTYNHKLRRVDRLSGAVSTFYAENLAEPTDVLWDEASASFLVCDTNHHRIVRVSADGKTMTPRDVRNAPSPKERIHAARPAQEGDEAEWFRAQLVEASGGALAPGRGEIAIDVPAPAGKKFAAASPFRASLEVSRRSDLLVVAETELRREAKGGASERLVLAVEVTELPEAVVESELVLRIDAIVCDVTDDAGAACTPRKIWLRVPVRLARAGTNKLDFAAQ